MYVHADAASLSVFQTRRKSVADEHFRGTVSVEKED